LLGRHSIAPGNLRVAAGLGNQQLLDQCFRGEDTLRPESVCGARFPPATQWIPRLAAVARSAKYWTKRLSGPVGGRTEVLPRLVRAGACLDADPYRGTPLIWAAVCNRIETAEWLIDRGASMIVKPRSEAPRMVRGVTALHMASRYGHLSMVSRSSDEEQIRRFRTISITGTPRSSQPLATPLFETTCAASRSSSQHTVQKRSA
jgi:hypothetical protein